MTILLKATDLGEPTQLSDHLWMGPKPPQGKALARQGFQTLVLCADEYQPKSVLYPGLHIIHCPLDDSGPPITPREKQMALEAGDMVARHLLDKRQTVVTCQMGINRSGLVSALGLRRFLGISGHRARIIVQALRPGTLKNRSFALWLDTLEAPGG